MAIITTLLIGAAAAGLGLLGKASREVAKDEENKVYFLNNEIQKIVNETKKEIEESGKNLNNADNMLIEQKKNIINNELATFIETFKKLHNVEEKEKMLNTFSLTQLIESEKENLDVIKVNAKYRKEASNASIVAQTLLTPSIVSVGIIVKEFVSFSKSSDQLKVLEVEKKKALANREKSKIKIQLMDDAAIKCLEAKEVLTNLASILKTKTIELTKIANDNKNDFKKFSQQEKQLAFVCVNLSKAISDIIQTPFVFENGEINNEAVSCLNLAKNELSLKESNNE